jgi:hypothetical protein
VYCMISISLSNMLIWWWVSWSSKPHYPSVNSLTSDATQNNYCTTSWLAMAFATFITGFILVKTTNSQTIYKRRILLMSHACRISNSANHHNNLCKNNLILSRARQLKFEYHNSKPPGPINMIAQSETGTNS